MNGQTTFQDGPTRRDRGTARVMDRDEQWTDKARRTLAFDAKWSCINGSTFDADHIRFHVGDPPEPNLMGSVFRWGATQGLIERVGDSGAKRPSRHGARLSQWRGKAAPSPK